MEVPSEVAKDEQKKKSPLYATSAYLKSGIPQVSMVTSLERGKGEVTLTISDDEPMPEAEKTNAFVIQSTARTRKRISAPHGGDCPRAHS